MRVAGERLNPLYHPPPINQWKASISFAADRLISRL